MKLATRTIIVQDLADKNTDLKSSRLENKYKSIAFIAKLQLLVGTLTLESIARSNAIIDIE